MENVLFQGNWIDFIIVIVFLYFLIMAFRVGFISILADFMSFLLSLLIALRAYSFVAEFLRENFNLSHSLANALGFLATAVVIETTLGLIFSLFLKKIPYKVWKSKLNKVLSVIPAMGEALVLVSFFLTLIMGLPLSPRVKEDVSDSKIGSVLVERTAGLEARFNDIFGGVIQDTLTYLTVKPGSSEAVPITVNRVSLSIDEISEEAMFRMVNEERNKRGIPSLAWRPEVVPVARAHATDMWEREYFGHVSPDGEDVGDRLQKAEVGYTIAGENLALAPTLITAHNGLMNSEGHRENILEPRFRQIGIGVIDNGIYGKMFVQVFTD
jgi:uncharacterized protein YkwD/uncharacterized membrane protein required for colicin V production